MPEKRLNYLFQYTPFPELQFNIIQNNLIIQHNCLKRPPCSHRTYKRSPTMGKLPTTNRVHCTVYSVHMLRWSHGKQQRQPWFTNRAEYSVTTCETSVFQQFPLYWVPEKLPQIYTVIVCICIWKVA